MSDPVDQERVSRATDMALETMNRLVMDGEDPLVVQSIFSIGNAVSAHINKIEKDKYMEFCSAFYDSTPAFLKDIGLLED
jgi:hypothetical protein